MAPLGRLVRSYSLHTVEHHTVAMIYLDIPEWVYASLENQLGIWFTDNSKDKKSSSQKKEWKFEYEHIRIPIWDRIWKNVIPRKCIKNKLFIYNVKFTPKICFVLFKMIFLISDSSSRHNQ